MRRHSIIAFLAMTLFLCLPLQAAELIMVEQRGCEWCRAWDAQIGVVYPRTPEGKASPLRRINIHDPLPADLNFIKGLVYTPTFVLVDQGVEVGRITGYPGQDFFWGLLQQLQARLRPEGS